MLMALIDRAAERTPDKPAIVCGDTRLSYGALARRICQCAAGLAALGVRPGDGVGLILPNRPEFVIAFFAVMRLGAIAAPVSPQATQAEIQRLLIDADPRVIIVDGVRLNACEEVADRLPSRPVLVQVGGAGQQSFDELGADFATVPDVGAADSRALYLYTSGSTDTFKRICCTQSNLWFEAANFVEATGQSADDTILCAVPLHHSYGLGNGLLDAAYAGATLVLEREPEAPFIARHEAMLGLLRAENVGVFLGVPFQYDVLATSQTDVAAAFSRVRWCVSSGDVLLRRTFETFRARSGQPIRSLYGSTEAGSIAMEVGPAAEVCFGDLGRPLANVTIDIRGPAGEIWVKSPTIPPGGYDNRPELNKTVFQDGFYNSGDLGRIDERGHLVMTGRKQSFFNVGGHKVDLAEVEEVLLAHPHVREAVVVGAEVPHLGGMLKAVVAAQETCREADILGHCRRLLAPFKVPRLVEFRQTLPRSPLGKVLRSELLQSDDWLMDVRSARDVPAGSRADQIDWVALRIREQVAAILASEPQAIARRVPFQNLGFDSLRAIELQERLSRMSGVALSITTLWNYPSIDAYAAFLLDAIQGPTPPAASTAETIAVDPLDDIPDGDIAALLALELTLSAEEP
jgi:long-chain acyl-CoA synthetase